MAGHQFGKRITVLFIDDICLEYKTLRIPVVNTINNLVGIITKTDIIRRLAEET
jgi:CBS domain-containing protein